MRGLRFLALSLLCALPVAPAFAGSTPAKKPDVARNQALIAFQRDLVSVLAPRADAMPLLGAALLARPLPNQPKYNDFHTLIDRASQADDSGPEVSWVRLSDCDEQADTCPNQEAMAKLTEQAPDNAAVWLLKLGQDVRNDKKKLAREELAKAAAAKLYDDYTGASLKALASTVSALPPPADTIDPASAAGASGVQAMIVYSVAGTLPQSGLQATAKLCESDSDDPTLKDDCLKLGKTLEWGSSPLARSLGLHLREVLSSDAEQQEDAKRARRSLIWQVQNFAQLSTRAASDKATAQHLLALARSGGTEMSMVLAALRDYSISVDPPTDWQPQSAQAKEAHGK
ncbi:hypothetical protein [Dyella silvatica]|uniref:hypothetical protein n=1 Tax=Dyella silvatica TaxID=2992128 RepID=UPI0022577EC8|nr:hypothetical protein [Dyella silvatica]